MLFKKIESLESRIFFSAVAQDVTQEARSGFNALVVSSTIPPLLIIGGKKIHGVVDVQIEGNAGYAQKGIFKIEIDAEAGGVVTPLAMAKRRVAVLAEEKMDLKIAVGSIGKIEMAGSYAIFAQVTDPAGATGVSPVGQTLVAQQKTYAFSETVISSRDVSIFESDDYITGLVAAYTLQITNTGNVATTGQMQIKLEQDASTTADVTYLSPVKITRAISVPVGESRVVTVKFKFTVEGVPSTGFLPVLAISQDGVSEAADGDYVLSG